MYQSALFQNAEQIFKMSGTLVIWRSYNQIFSRPALGLKMSVTDSRNMSLKGPQVHQLLPGVA